LLLNQDAALHNESWRLIDHKRSWPRTRTSEEVVRAV